jgi:hypothetical protein
MLKIPFSILCLLLFSVGACTTAFASEKSFLDEVKKNQEHFDNRAVPNVRMVTERSVLAEEKDQRGSFRVLARKQEITRYACSSCHNDKPVKVNAAKELTHGNIVIDHGQGAQGLSCIDCHHPEERDFLHDKEGNKIDYDHSYQLCGQCHFRQKRDWLGGAHGKRVSNWAGERVIYNCATCHDPHSPRFEKRFPATYSVPLD